MKNNIDRIRSQQEVVRSRVCVKSKVIDSGFSGERGVGTAYALVGGRRPLLPNVDGEG
jgi:hypothetical protein